MCVCVCVCVFAFFLISDSGDLTGSKWERKGDGIRKDPQGRNRTRDTQSATALYVGMLPTRVSGPTQRLF